MARQFGAPILLPGDPTSPLHASTKQYVDAVTAADVGAQPLDADLTTIAGLTHANDTILQTKSGAWAARTPAQVKTDLALVPSDVGVTPALPVPASGQYFCPVSSALLQTSSGHGANSLRVVPWLVPKTISVSRIAMEVFTAGSAGSLMRLGIYDDNGAGQPGTLLVDAGTVSTSSTGVKELTISQTLQPGLYWLGGALQGTLTTGPVITCCGANFQPVVPCSLGSSLPAVTTQAQGYYNTASVTGALPNPFPSATLGAAGLIVRPMVKVA